MKVITQNLPIQLLRFDQNEELISTLQVYCQEQQIFAASFTGIGAADEVIIAYYNLQTKEYEDHSFSEEVEILSLTGNISLLDSKPIIHCHGVFGKKDCSTIGGHVKKIVISATGEITLTQFPSTIERAYDSVTGLNLLK